MKPGVIGWDDAYVRARDFISQLTLLEKVNLTTGVGYVCRNYFILVSLFPLKLLSGGTLYRSIVKNSVRRTNYAGGVKMGERAGW